MKTKKDETEKALTIRLPESLFMTLKEKAIASQRSLNSEIVFALQQHVEPKKGK